MGGGGGGTGTSSSIPFAGLCMEPATPMPPEGPTGKPAGKGTVAGGGEWGSTILKRARALPAMVTGARRRQAGVMVSGAGATGGEKVQSGMGSADVSITGGLGRGIVEGTGVAEPVDPSSALL